MLLGLENNTYGVDFCMRLKDRILAGIVMTSDFSGMGTAEEAMRHLAHSLSIKFGVQIGSVQSSRAGDVKVACQKVLAAHTGLCKPCCVSSDMLHRLPRPLLASLRALGDEAWREVQQLQRGGVSCKAATAQVGQSFARRAKDLVLAPGS
eukprot:14366472-Alexandrium_andersonii.AAC.1